MFIRTFILGKMKYIYQNIYIRKSILLFVVYFWYLWDRVCRINVQCYQNRKYILEKVSRRKEIIIVIIELMKLKIEKFRKVNLRENCFFVKINKIE